MGAVGAKRLDVGSPDDVLSCCKAGAVEQPERRAPRQEEDSPLPQPLPRPASAQQPENISGGDCLEEVASTPACVDAAATSAEVTRPLYVAPVLPNVVPAVAGVEHLEPVHVQELLRQPGCLLVDVRGSDRSTGWIQGSVHVPAIDTVPFITRAPELAQQWSDQRLVIFHCQYSAHRAPQCANWYRERASPSQRVAILAGGFRAWEGWQLPFERPPPASEPAGASATADAYAIRQGLQIAQQGSMSQASAQQPDAAPKQAAAAAPGAVSVAHLGG